MLAWLWQPGPGCGSPGLAMASSFGLFCCHQMLLGAGCKDWQ